MPISHPSFFFLRGLRFFVVQSPPRNGNYSFCTLSSAFNVSGIYGQLQPVWPFFARYGRRICGDFGLFHAFLAISWFPAHLALTNHSFRIRFFFCERISRPGELPANTLARARTPALPSRMICPANHGPAAEGVAARTVAGGARGAGVGHIADSIPVADMSPLAQTSFRRVLGMSWIASPQGT